jgi:hypothetical protein
MSHTLRGTPCRPTKSAAQLAHLVLSSAHNTCKSFLHTFTSLRAARRARGVPSDAEQDLLRAMVLFASAGLDSMIKQLIEDALNLIIENDKGAHQEFEKFVIRTLNVKSLDDQIKTINIKTLANIIISDSPKKTLVEILIYKLTSNSLQSVDQLLKVAAHFGITASDLSIDTNQLRIVFDVRNKISHEMDIDFTQSNRNRFPRRKNDMIDYTNLLLTTADKFLTQAANKLP